MLVVSCSHPRTVNYLPFLISKSAVFSFCNFVIYPCERNETVLEVLTSILLVQVGRKSYSPRSFLYELLYRIRLTFLGYLLPSHIFPLFLYMTYSLVQIIAPRLSVYDMCFPNWRRIYVRMRDTLVRIISTRCFQMSTWPKYTLIWMEWVTTIP